MTDKQVMVYEVMVMAVTFDGATQTWVDSPAHPYPGKPFVQESLAHRLAGDLNLNDMLKARARVEGSGMSVYDLSSFQFYYVRARPAMGRELAWLLRSVFIQLVTKGGA